ncbi:MAG: siderophore-interacting protein [Actinomycetota bacterium]
MTVAGVTPLTPRMVRVTVAGPELEGLVVEQPAASVRLLVPSAGAGELVMPAWKGNEFLLPDGSRPVIRTLTPLRVDPVNHRMDVEIVVHEGGAVSAWALEAQAGAEAAVSGPGRGYPVDPEARGFLLAGDESAIPAIGQLLEVLPPDKPVRVMIEVASPQARLELPKHRTAEVEWHDLAEGAPPGEAVVAAVTGAELPAGTRVWAAGEAAAMQRIRKHLFETRGLARSDTWIRGYWKHGRAGDANDD